MSCLSRFCAGVVLLLTGILAHAGIPHYDHVVIVMEENTSSSSIYGNSSAPYINSLKDGGVYFTQSFAIEHPSQPNYLDLFSGSNQGVTNDNCPQTFSTNNLGNQLVQAGFTFAGYSETLPSNGSTVCTSGTSGYARKHSPWVNFSATATGGNQTNLSSATYNKTYASFPTDFTTLPTVSFVIPNLCDDMHDCSTSTGDTWLKNNLDAYAQWAKTHNSLLIVTWDEDDSSTSANQIATIFYGANLNNGAYSETINHYTILRTLEDMYGLTAIGGAAGKTAITDVWAATAPDFNVASAPSSLNLQRGASGSETITIGSANGFNSAVNLTASGLPSGVTASFAPTSVTPAANGSSTSTLMLTASSTATTGAATVTVTGTSGTTTHTATFTLNVQAAPDFSMTTPPQTLTVQQGASGTDTATITSLNGFNSAVALSVTGLPAGVTAAFAPTSVTPTANGSAASTLTVNVASTANLGTSTITVTGTSGATTHSATFNLTITQVQPADFNLSASPSSLSVTQGASGNDTITVTSLNGFNATTSLSASGLPSGVTATFAPTSVTPAANGSTTSTLTLTASSTAATGTATVTVTGISGSTTHIATISLTVNAPASNKLQNGVPVSNLSGGTLNYSVDVPSGASNLVISISGGTGDADLYVKFGAAPTKTSYDCRPYVSGNSESCPFATPAVGTYYIMLDPYQAYTGVTLKATWSVSTPNFSIAASPTTLSVTQGASGNDTITVTSLNGFNAATSLSASGLPSGVSAAFSPTSVTPAANGSTTSVLTLTAASTAATGAATVTITGTSGSTTHTATIALTVNASGGGSTQLLANTGFENTTSWTASSGVICATGCSGESAHTGSGFAWLDGYGSAHTDTLSQQVAITASKTSATLSYYLHIDTAETGSTAYDTLKVELYSTSGTLLTTLHTYSNANAASGYTLHTDDVSAYIGQTVVLKFTGVEDSSSQTSFVLDDVTLTVQ